MALSRRNLIGMTAGAAGATLLPAKSAIGAFAKAATVPTAQRYLVDKAQSELDRAGAKLWKRDKVGIVDFGLPSNEPRLFVVDMMGGTIRSYLCSHGSGSDPEHDGWLNSFSNVSGSKATSRGAYMSLQWYKGKYGSSMRLEGLDSDNHAALDRAIVVHEAWYADAGMVRKWGKLGRSEGCFAVSPGMNKDMLYHLGGGRLLFADMISKRERKPIGSPEFVDNPGWTAGNGKEES